MQALPVQLTNKSCVAVADVNRDGYLDIFAGGLTNAKEYGFSPQASCLLLNDGKGHFKNAPTNIFSLNEPGVVTTATFADINKDGWMDLLVAGEWMGVKIFINHSGNFTAAEIPNSNGLWQSLYVTDINRDGWPDILAGNWGHNSKLRAGQETPLTLYIKDFYGNGSVQHVLASTINGNEYSFLGKDQLEQALPVLKKGHLSYTESAGKTVQEMFGDLLKNAVELRVTTLSSSCFLNDGRGNFRQENLPEELQLAPVFSFVSLPFTNEKTYLAAGNFYGVLPYEGRYDALSPTVFSYGTGFNVQSILPAINAEIRDQAFIRYFDGTRVLVMAANNHELIFLKM